MQKQTTLAKTAVYKGIGLHSGREVSIELMPAEPDSGIVFLRTDLEGNPEIKASAENVSVFGYTLSGVLQIPFIEKAKQIIKNILEQGVNRKPGALLTQIGLCTTGCFIEDSVAWNNHSTAQLYRTIYMACKK